MVRVATALDGWRLLKALGVSEDRRIRKAVITMEVGHAVMIETEEYSGAVVDDALEMIPRTYRLEEMSNSETDREEAAYYNGCNDLQVK